MKFSSFLLPLSLVGNLALGGAVLFWQPAAPASRGAVSPEMRAGKEPGSPSAAASVVPVRSGASAVSDATAWSKLHTADLPTLVARLRAAGFPESVVRAMIQTLVNERFGELFRLQRDQENPAAYWQTRPEYYGSAREEILRLAREREQLLKRLLGPDGGDENMAAFRARHYGPKLSPEKIEQVEAIDRRYGELREQVYARGGGSVLPDDAAKLNQWEREQRAELAKMLTADELFELGLRSGSAAMQLRHDVAWLDVSEAEFRTLFPLYRELSEKFPTSYGFSSPEEMAPREAARRQMHEQVKALLGPERYAQFELAQNYDYQQTAKVVARLKLPQSTTREIYALQKDFQQRAAALRSNPVVAERNAQLTALAAEAGTKLGSVLGASGLEAYRQYSGSWLQNLAPRAAAPRPAIGNAP